MADPDEPLSGKFTYVHGPLLNVATKESVTICLYGGKKLLAWCLLHLQVRILARMFENNYLNAYL